MISVMLNLQQEGRAARAIGFQRPKADRDQGLGHRVREQASEHTLLLLHFNHRGIRKQ